MENAQPQPTTLPAGAEAHGGNPAQAQAESFEAAKISISPETFELQEVALPKVSISIQELQQLEERPSLPPENSNSFKVQQEELSESRDAFKNFSLPAGMGVFGYPIEQPALNAGGKVVLPFNPKPAVNIIYDPKTKKMIPVLASIPSIEAVLVKPVQSAYRALVSLTSGVLN